MGSICQFLNLRIFMSKLNLTIKIRDMHAKECTVILHIGAYDYKTYNLILFLTFYMAIRLWNIHKLRRQARGKGVSQMPMLQHKLMM